MYETTIIISGKIDISSFSPLNALNIKGKIEQHSLRHFSNGVISKNPIFWFWFSMAFNSFWYYRCYERKILWNFQVQKSLKVTRTKFQVIWPFAEDVQWVSVWTVLLLHVNITCIKHYEIQLKNNFESTNQSNVLPQRHTWTKGIDYAVPFWMENTSNVYNKCLCDY